MQTGMVTLPEESYYMSVVPINLDVLHLVLLNLGSLLISCLMLVGPSFMVARISPLRAVRYS
jgi:lipoprotein-releasing system permease protein